MISKEEFCKYLNYIKRTSEKADEISNIVEKIDPNGSVFAFSDEISAMIEMLSACVGLEYKTYDPVGNDIEYYIYELEWGRKWKPGMVTEDGEDIDISTPEKLYDYIAGAKDE